MPNRYTLFDIGELKDTFALPLGVPAGVKKSYNISPTQTVPAIRIEDGQRVAERMKWGFVPKNAKDMNSVFRYKTHHIPSGAVLTKKSWQDVVRTQRCLIPANGFYEWRNAPEGKRAYYLRLAERPLFAFAGVYGEWTDPEGVTHGVCAAITTRSDSQSDQIPSILPVIVDPADEDDWLNPEVSDTGTLFKILRPLEPEDFIVTRVGDAVHSVKPNSADLILPFHRKD